MAAFKSLPAFFKALSLSLILLSAGLMLSTFHVTAALAAEEAAPAEAAGAEGEGAAALDAIMSAPEIGYYVLKPDFTTNLFSSGVGKLHYVRVQMTLMLADSRDADFVKSVEPLVRDAVLSILGAQDYAEVSSAAGRESIRAECRSRIGELLKSRLEHDVVYDVLFTNYVYQ